MIYKHELSMNLPSGDFRFVTGKPQSTDKRTALAFDPSNDITKRLTDADCQEFINDLKNALHDSELLYRHVTGFVQKMSKKE